MAAITQSSTCTDVTDDREVTATVAPAGARSPGRIRPLCTALVSVVSFVILVAGCSGPLRDAPRGTVTTVVSAPVQGGVAGKESVHDQAPPHAEPTDPGAHDRLGHIEPEAFDRIAAALPNGSGLAVAPIGRPDLLRTAGDLGTDVAWSTVKVPLAIAALRVAPDLTGVAERAITLSDNVAADALWAALGGEPGAAAAVEAVMAQAGDVTTRVPTSRERPGFSIFGQTRWSLDDQARFAAGLACLADAEPVLEMMERIDGSQQWGLGLVPGAGFKGGWGPSADGAGYLVRQFGVIDTRGGRAGVAIAARAADMDSGAALLSAIAVRIASEAGGLPGGDCQ